MLKRDNPICIKCGGDKREKGNGFTKEGICKLCLNARSRQYKANHKEEISRYNKLYKEENKEEISKYNARYTQENGKKIQARVKEREATIPAFKIRKAVARRIGNALGGMKTGWKSAVSIELLGCSPNFCRKWLEFQFTEEMTFNNHGKVWHIDHIVPCSRFDLEDEDEQRRCFNWTNLQPLLKYDNWSKGDKLSKKDINKNKETLDKLPKIIKFDRNKYL